MLQTNKEIIIEKTLVYMTLLSSLFGCYFIYLTYGFLISLPLIFSFVFLIKGEIDYWRVISNLKKNMPSNLKNATTHKDFGDIDEHINMRGWMKEQAEKSGMTVTGGGSGVGGSDIDIIFKGKKYNLKMQCRGEITPTS